MTVSLTPKSLRMLRYRLLVFFKAYTLRSTESVKATRTIEGTSALERMQDKQALQEFADFVKQLRGDEKSEAQLFCDRFFRAFGHGGIIEANGELEARIKFSDSGRTKFADCLWSPPGRDGVLIEMKSKAEKNLDAHFSQARDYWIEMNPEKVIGPGAQKPVYIILCNFERFLIYRQLSLVDEIKIDEFVDRASAFNFMLPETREPIFRNNVEAISQDAARTIGELFKLLVFENGEDREVAQRFVLQCVLALFSEDFGLLPNFIFAELIRDCKEGQSSYDLFGGLFNQMASVKAARGGRFKEVRYFNGGILDVVEPLELDSTNLGLLEEAAQFNWKGVNPSIFGALFESTLNEQERHKFGAHYTSEADILKIVNPTIVRPWKDRIQEAKRLQDLSDLLDDLEKFRVLDPACGCGNFLYMAYRSLKDIEMQIIEKIAANFTARSVRRLKFGISRVSTKQFHGIDILPIAVEVAKMTMMLAKELAADEWNQRISSIMAMLGLNFDEGLPLERLDEFIVCDDALFCDWPEFDAVIGNPPYQSKNKMQAELGREYVNQLRAQYPEVPGRADYCVYWFRRTHDEIEEGQRAGLVGTNTIRQNYSREGGLDYLVGHGGTITNAVSSQVWSGDAAVHVSIVNWVKAEDEGMKQLVFQRGNSVDSPFEYNEVKEINSALSLAIDLTSAATLKANRDPKRCFQGQTHGHEGFLVPRAQAEGLLRSNGKYREVLFPFLTANEMIGGKDSLPRRYVIDFREHDIYSAKQYPELLKALNGSVLPDRKAAAKEEENRNKAARAKDPRASVNHHHANFLRQWWKLSYPRNDLMDKLEKLPRYCACGQVTKRPIFEFISTEIHPNAALMVFTLPDDYSYGILQSEVHWEWFTAMCSTLTARFRYTSNTVFDSFPWPQNPSTKQVREIARIAVELRSMRRQMMDKNDFSLRDLYRVMEETPVNRVSEIQDSLDAAVRRIYGMKVNDDILGFLLDLNLDLAEKETNGEEVVGPGLPPTIDNPAEFITQDCVSAP